MCHPPLRQADGMTYFCHRSVKGWLRFQRGLKKAEGIKLRQGRGFGRRIVRGSRQGYRRSAVELASPSYISKVPVLS